MDQKEALTIVQRAKVYADGPGSVSHQMRSDLDRLYGAIESSWGGSGEAEMKVVYIPPGCTATLIVTGCAPPPEG